MKRLNALQGENAEESYKTLKNGVKYLIFLIVFIMLIITDTEARDKYDLSKVVTDYLDSIQLLDISQLGEDHWDSKLDRRDIKGGYQKTVAQLISRLELDQIGNNYLLGDDYLRITYRLMGEEINEKQSTATIFPS